MPGPNPPGWVTPGQYSLLLGITVTPAEEIDEAIPVQINFVVPAEEVDEAEPVLLTRAYTITPAEETDTAVPATVARRYLLDVAEETDEAEPVEVIQELPAATTDYTSEDAAWITFDMIGRADREAAVLPPPAPTQVAYTNYTLSCSLGSVYTGEVVVESWSSDDPFGYKSASIRLPLQVPASSVGASYLGEPVSITANGVTVFDGEVTGYRGTNEGTVLECIGRLYLLDFDIKKPEPVWRPPTDVGTLISEATDSSLPGNEHMRTFPIQGAATGVLALPGGSWQKLLSGFVQDMLGLARDYTITSDGRMVQKSNWGNTWSFDPADDGVEVDLGTDLTAGVSTIYGSGVAPDNCAWRNEVFPHLDVWNPANPAEVEADPERVNVPPSPEALSDAYVASLAESGGYHMERYENFGTNIYKSDAIVIAEDELAQEGDPGVSGTVTLRGSIGIAICAGDGVNIAGFPTLHVAHVDTSKTGDTYTTTLQCTEKFDHAITLATKLSGERETNDLIRRRNEYRNRRSKLIDDTSSNFDCESGAGFISPNAVQVNTWLIQPVVAGEVVDFVKSEFRLLHPAPFVVGVFDREIQPWQMQRLGDPLGPGPFNPGEGTEDIPVFWDAFPDPNDPTDLRLGGPFPSGLVFARGDAEHPLGIWPYAIDNPAAIFTGIDKDPSNWHYESPNPPWLWVAVWVGPGDEAPEANVFWGRLFAAPNG